MRIPRPTLAVLSTVFLLEAFGASRSIAAPPFPLLAPVEVQSRAYRRAVRYTMNHPFSLGPPVAIPIQTVPMIPARNVVSGYYSPRGYYYRFSYASPVMGGPAVEPVRGIPEVIRPSGETVPVGPEIIPAPQPEG